MGRPPRPRPNNAPGNISPPQDSPWKIIGAIFAILFVFCVFAVVAKFVRFDCDTAPMMLLAYPLLFGAAGAVLGGSIVLRGPISLAGQNLTATVVGGIAAALLGFAIAYTSKPSCPVSAWKSQLVIAGIPTNEPSGRTRPPFFVTTQTVGADYKLVPRGIDSGTLEIRFSGSETNVLMRMYQQDEKNQNIYRFVGACSFTFLAKKGDNTISTDIELYKAKSGSDDIITLRFRPNLGDSIAEASRNGDDRRMRNIVNRCLEAELQKGGGHYVDGTPIESDKLYIAETSQFLPYKNIELWFTVPKGEAVDAKQIAQETAPSNKELPPPPAEVVVLPPPSSSVSSTLREQPTAAQVPTKVQAVTDSQKQPTTNERCITDETLRQKTIAYLSGDELDRPQRNVLYENWSAIGCYTIPLMYDDSSSRAVGERARAVRLLTNAIINNSGLSDRFYWQPSANKRDFGQRLPFPSDKDLVRILELTTSADDTIRAEAVRLVKFVPSDQVESFFQQKLLQMGSAGWDSVKRERLSVAAISLYYNRIVEWLNLLKPGADTFPNAAVMNAVAADLARSIPWLRNDFFNGRSAKPYEAMLLYGKGVVERELKLTADRGKTTFNSMLDALRSTNEPYPSYSQHIAQALAVAYVPQQNLLETLRVVAGAKNLDLIKVLDDQPPFVSGSYPLYASPGPAGITKLTPTVNAADRARVLLQLDDWFLITAKSKIGWIKVSS